MSLIMLSMPEQSLAEASSSRNLNRLFILRSLLIAGETLAVLGAHFLLGIQLHLPALLAIVALLALVNIRTWRQVRRQVPVSDAEMLGQLCVDVAAIAGLLYFSGGATNPFAWLFLIPLIVAATVLSAGATWLIAGLSTLCYSLLMRYYHQPPGNHGHMGHGDTFSQHVFGMWSGFVVSAGLIAWLVAGMARSLRTRDRLLAEAREKALRDEKLVALGTLATGAAHELGTPLATMAVVTRELERNQWPAATQRKLRILKDQIVRCKVALSTLSASAGEVRAEGGGLMPVENFIEELVARWKQRRPNAELRLRIERGPPETTIISEQTLEQALINLLDNAADASSEALTVEVGWTTRELAIDILDRGPGIQTQAVERVDQPKTSRKEFGLGLGLFLAHATVQRLGGEIALIDRDGGGTRTIIRVPLTQMH
jgi:two-component system sensor histidine kinase RegB